MKERNMQVVVVKHGHVLLNKTCLAMQYNSIFNKFFHNLFSFLFRLVYSVIGHSFLFVPNPTY